MKILKIIGAAVLTTLVALGVTAIVNSISNTIKNKDDYKEISIAYQIGGLDATGEFVDTDKSIVSKELINTMGKKLRFEIDFDAPIKYQFYCYNIEEEFLTKSEILNSTKNYDLAHGTAYIRVVIYPEFKEDDDKVTFFNQFKYTSQLDVMAIEYTYLLEIDYEDISLDVNFHNGMRWKDFINSDLNVLGFYFDSNNRVLVSVDGQEYYLMADENHIFNNRLIGTTDEISLMLFKG